MKVFRSLRYTIAFIVGVIIFLICSGVIAYRFYALEIAKNQAAESIQTTMRLYLSGLESYLETSENYLLSKSLMDDQKMRLKDPRSELKFYLAEITITSEFSDTITDNKYLDGIFLYNPKEDIFLYGKQEGVSQADISAIREGGQEIIEKFETEGQGQWYFVSLEEAVYYTRTFVNNNLYTSGCINVSKIQEELKTLCVEEDEYFVIFDDKNLPVAGDHPGHLPKFPEKKKVRLNYSNYTTISSKSKLGFTMVIYKKTENLIGAQNSIGFDIFISLVLILVIVVILLRLLNRSFMHPLMHIIAAMERLQKGDFEVKLAVGSSFKEFEMINNTFDTMTEQIKELKISIYEEKIHQQTAKLQYLQLQINPHFLTNCLNLIRNLSIMDRAQGVEDAILLLSRYIRYTMRTKTTVSLEREIEHVQDYINLQKMRYEEGLECELIVDEELLSATIPSMAIQTFVDNAVKHQMTPEKPLYITVRIYKVERPYGRQSLYISIEDNGDGFEDGVLKKINNNVVIEKEDEEHIGI